MERPGTRIEVRHLFFNVPVRKKFLKSVATELGHVCEAVTRLGARPPLATHHPATQRKTRLRNPGLGRAWLDRIALFFGGEVRDALYEIDSGPGSLRATGFIADPKCDRGNAKLQYLFVNGRWFRDRSIVHTRCKKRIAGARCMTGRCFSVGFLFLTLPPDKVDDGTSIRRKPRCGFQENSLVLLARCKRGKEHPPL